MMLPGYITAEPNQKLRETLREALMTGASRHLTICEQLRFIYDTVYRLPEGEHKEDLTEKLVDALNMAKKMNSRLAKYKRQYNDPKGSAGSNLIVLEHTDERAAIRNERSK